MGVSEISLTPQVLLRVAQGCNAKRATLGLGCPYLFYAEGVVARAFRSAITPLGPYRLLDREDERPEDPRLGLLRLGRCTDGRGAERDGRPMLDLLDDRGTVRLVEPYVDLLERCKDRPPLRLTEGFERLVERLRPNRGFDCLGFEGVR